jgi:manganese transport protein
MPLFEAAIATLIGVIAVSYAIEAALGKPDFGAIADSFLPPRLGGQQGTLLATGILGATVQRTDVALALGLAGVINVLMVVVAAATSHEQGLVHTAGIEQAYRTLTPILGGAASAVFAVALLALGLSSSAVGTFAGQVITRGFLQRTIPLWIRRLVTMLPALATVAAGVDPTRALVISQVVLPFGTPQALIPLACRTVTGFARQARNKCVTPRRDSHKPRRRTCDTVGEGLRPRATQAV